MGSIAPQLLAQKISANIRKGKRTILYDAIKSVGYPHSVARKPKLVTETLAFKKAFALENKDIVQGLDLEIARIQLALSRKNLSKEEYKTLVQAFDIQVKNKQLLSGGSTANVAIKVAISEHIAGKYDKSPSDDVENGSTEPHK